jgi:transcription termination factor Rho
MREKLQTLPLPQLKELAKSQHIKGCSTMRKAELIDVLCAVAEKTDILRTVAVPRQPIVQPPRQDNASGPVSEPSRPYEGERKAVDSDRRADNTGDRRTDNNNDRRYDNNDRRYDNSDRRYDNSDRRYDNGDRRTDNTNERRYTTNNTSQRTYGDNRQPRTYIPRPQQTQAMPQPELTQEEVAELDSGVEANGILEVMPDGFGFIRCENFLPGENDVYVAPSQIRRFNLKTGDIIMGSRRVKTAAEKFAALLYIKNVNGYPISVVERRPSFEKMTPIFPNQRLHMETMGKSTVAMRVLDLLAPIGKGQRGMIVSPPKAGKTTLLKQVAQAITTNHPDMHLIILLIDERPEEVTDIRESVVGDNVEVIYSTFDELPERHKRVSEMVIERAKRLVEHGRDVIILLDSITRLARAYNMVVPPSGRTLSGGLDPAALHMPKRFFGAARNMREGGSLTILATALVDTGSRMDDVIYEEFKGTGNMELVLDRKLSEKRIFPAIDILKSGTRRDDLLLTAEEAEAVDNIRKATNSMKPEESVEKILDLFARTKTNAEFVANAKKMRFY